MSVGIRSSVSGTSLRVSSSAVERRPQARPDVEVGFDDLGAQLRQLLRFLGIDVPGEGAHGEGAAAVAQ
jgi:hypothetical protein